MWSSGQRCACLLFCLLLSWTTAGAADTPVTRRTAIVLAAFGTSVPEALEGIVHIRDRIRQKFPHSEVRLAFTADSIRATWNERQHDQAFRAANPGVPADIYAVRSPLATIADLREEGFRTILVQPGHISLGEEYLDLVETVRALNSITTVKAKNRPFDHLVVSRPALGTMGTVHPVRPGHPHRGRGARRRRAGRPAQGCSAPLHGPRQRGSSPRAAAIWNWSRC